MVQYRSKKFDTFRMWSNISNNQLINFYIHRLLYMNLMVTKNQKPIIDTHTKKKRMESKHNIPFKPGWSSSSGEVEEEAKLQRV